ncbi:hypothetical protein P2318_28320 [Myxococcaceae bacterium GXIMD 01537]
MRRLPLLLPLFVLAAGCTTLRGQADSLAREGRFVEAAQIYEALVQKEPEDRTLINTRDDLRWKALEQSLGRARRSRVEGDDETAERFLEEFLGHRERWNSKLNGALESSLLTEMEGTHAHCRALISEPARKGLALTAEHGLGLKRALLAYPEMAPILREMEGTVLRAGQAECARLRALPTEGAPYWTDLVYRYCRRWREQAPAGPAPAATLGTPEWDGWVEGLSPEATEALKSRLSLAFERSPFYAPGASTRPTLKLSGRTSTRRSRETVKLTAPWTDSEPYTDHEERTETFEEPYTEEETYTDEHGQTKTRTVTKTRTREHKYTVAVTRYRDVQKTFEYYAQLHEQLLQFSVSSTGVLDARRGPITVLESDQNHASSYEHDVTFSPGGVSPQRLNLPSSEAWVSKRLDELEASFSQQLVARWLDFQCAEPPVTLDDAARCVRAGTARLPAFVYPVLSGPLGADAERAYTLYLPR